jgi:hypothetical protein
MAFHCASRAEERGYRICIMSALPPKADIPEREEHVRFVPKADILRAVKNVVVPRKGKPN